MEGTQQEHDHSHYSMGLSTLRVPMAMFKQNREKLVAELAKDGGVAPNSVVILRGAKQQTRFDTDHEPLMRQESNFHYLFGVTESGFYGVIDANTGKTTLFVPKLPESYAVWMGRIEPPSFYKDKYGVDEVHYVDDLSDQLTANKTSVIYLLKGKNSDSGNDAKPAKFTGSDAFTVDLDRLHPAIVRSRVFKTPSEIEVLRYAAKVSSEAHIKVMQTVRPGMMEYQLESTFLHHAYHSGGCRLAGYTCICGSGNNSSTLHYGHAGAPNTRKIQNNDMLLLDMGAEYYCYGADITCSYPANGTFSASQRAIYETVLNAQTAVLNAIKPGVQWVDMHMLAYRVICENLKAAGILKGDVDEMLANHIPALFMPHGLGHLLGIDTHDVGGYPDPSVRSTAPGVRSLRMGRVLEAGMYLTVEPGVYFIDHLLDSALRDTQQAAFIVAEKLAEFRGFGGVRLEDDVLVTATGHENFTLCPRTVQEVEDCMAGRSWNKNSK
eukprot:TRINITY_DN14067_c0_g1_i1.p1 TRINITY_DN14067_c0_g1~~TRINITY_DN14067_c0_g1_i1.p1  ORF type:complete len:494 (+),score=81.22 TRINITY_DN14067_c0_g1_i1:60-1541(+)